MPLIAIPIQANALHKGKADTEREAPKRASRFGTTARPIVNAARKIVAGEKRLDPRLSLCRPQIVDGRPWAGAGVSGAATKEEIQ